MLGIVTYSKQFNQSFKNFIGCLINDKLFIRNFSIISYYVLETSVLKDIDNIFINGNENASYEVWNSFWFHSFNDNIIEYNIVQKKFQ